MMGGQIDARARKALGKVETPEEFLARREAAAKAKGMTLAEYDAWIEKEAARWTAEAAADSSTDDI